MVQREGKLFVQNNSAGACMYGVSMNFLGAEYQRHLVELEGDLAACRSFAYDALILSQIFTYIKRGKNKMKSEIDKSWKSRFARYSKSVGCKQGKKENRS